jgi:glutamate racemase
VESFQNRAPIGVFDSGYGGLTVFRAIAARLPQYDYCYLGDNARAPYGTRSFETVYRYTLECVEWFFRARLPARHPRLQHGVGPRTAEHPAE